MGRQEGRSVGRRHAFHGGAGKRLAGVLDPRVALGHPADDGRPGSSGRDDRKDEDRRHRERQREPSTTTSTRELGRGRGAGRACLEGGQPRREVVIEIVHVVTFGWVAGQSEPTAVLYNTAAGPIHAGRVEPAARICHHRSMAIDPRAGRPAEPSMLVDVDGLIRAYYEIRPDPSDPAQRVAFGTSGHRGSALNAAFNEAHIAATTEAICRYRTTQGTDGPLFIGRDTHALSGPAMATALRVLAAHDVDVRVDAADGYTPTPVISHAILVHNRDRSDRLADGIVVTPSHNPPEDGGFKYNPPNGGPADTDVTTWIQDEANRLLEAGLDGVRRVPIEQARARTTAHDYIGSYVGDLDAVIDMDAIRASGLRLGVDPLGGASVAYWPAIG